MYKIYYVNFAWIIMSIDPIHDRFRLEVHHLVVNVKFAFTT